VSREVLTAMVILRVATPDCAEAMLTGEFAQGAVESR
jgi:hypothetical protein